MHKIIKIILPIFLACGIFNAADGSNYDDYDDYDDDAIPPNKPENPANKLEKFNDNHKNLIRGWISEMHNNPETKTTFTEFNDCLAKERKILLSIITLLRSIDPNIEDIGDCHQIHDLYIAASTIKDDIECMLKVTEILDGLDKRNYFKNHVGDDLAKVHTHVFQKYIKPFERLKSVLESGKIISFMIGYKYLKYIDNAEKLKKIEESPSLIKLKNELKQNFPESKWKSDYYSPSTVTDIIIKFNIINYLIESKHININEKKNSITLSSNLDYRKESVKNTLKDNSSLKNFQFNIKNKNPAIKKRLENHNAALVKEMKSLVDIIKLLRSSSSESTIFNPEYLSASINSQGVKVRFIDKVNYFEKLKELVNNLKASMNSQDVKVRFIVKANHFEKLKELVDLKDDIECMARVSAWLSASSYDIHQSYNYYLEKDFSKSSQIRYTRYQTYYLMFFYKFIKYQYNNTKSFKYRDKLIDMLDSELNKEYDNLNNAYSRMAKIYHNNYYKLNPEYFLSKEIIAYIQRFMVIYDLIELEKNKNFSDTAYDDDYDYD